MLCSSQEVIDDSQCPCKTCLLRNVYSDELDDYLRQHGKLKEDEPSGVKNSPEPKNKIRGNKKILLLVVNSSSDGHGKTQGTGASHYNKNNYNFPGNKGRGNVNAMGMMRLDETDATQSCDLCDPQNPYLKKSPSMVGAFGHSETLCACKQIDQSKDTSNFGCNHEGAFNSECGVEADFRDRCKREKRCGRHHPILIRKPICKENQKMGKGGICDPWAESDDDDCSPESASTCWCDMRRLEHTFSRIVPNEDCMCYCKKYPEPKPILKKKKKPKKKMYSRYWKLDPVILCPRPCYLENPCRCREWCGYHPCWPDPKSVYRCDYMPYC